MNLVQILQIGSLELYRPVEDKSHLLSNGRKRYVCAGNDFSIILVDVDESYKVVRLSEIRPHDTLYFDWLNLKFAPVDNLHLRF